ncbi:MAG TPA: monovalent cation/H+ antiporter complex subunit F [Terracidiphilus sp.]|nr:monovalent cation/H+ antiporter complex subunit F [Terracidiphilus sp.]
MNPWLAGAYAVGACLAPCAWMCLRGSPEGRLVGLEMTSNIVILLLALLVAGLHTYAFIDLPLTLAVLTLGAGLVFARFLEKYL